MSAIGVDPAEVTRQLRAEGLAVERVGDFWGCAFEVEGTKQRVLLFLGPDSEYFTMACPIISEQLNAAPRGLLQTTLATLVELGSEVMLAKVTYMVVNEEILYIADSHCSVKTWDGEKLHRRMMDVAILAARIQLALGFPARRSSVG